MKIDRDPFRTSESGILDLAMRSTGIPSLYQSHKHFRVTLNAYLAGCTGQQRLLRSNITYPLAVIFQAMDATGKDSAINLDCINTPEKNWKLSLADIDRKKFWRGYQNGYEDMLSTTRTAYCPRYGKPADGKQNTHLIVSDIILDALGALHMHFPTVGPKRQRELRAIGKQLVS